jgi:hypothetical protein
MLKVAVPEEPSATVIEVGEKTMLLMVAVRQGFVIVISKSYVGPVIDVVD